MTWSKDPMVKAPVWGIFEEGTLNFMHNLTENWTKPDPALAYETPPITAAELDRRKLEDGFVIKHFAGDVVYYSAEFLEKNNDSLDSDVEAALLASSHPLVATVCTPEADGGGKKKKTAFASVGDKFVKSLRTLMSELALSTALFVRCIKPNQQKSPTLFDAPLTLEQRAEHAGERVLHLQPARRLLPEEQREALGRARRARIEFHHFAPFTGDGRVGELDRVHAFLWDARVEELAVGAQGPRERATGAQAGL